jgi:hypothetical protein
MTGWSESEPFPHSALFAFSCPENHSDVTSVGWYLARSTCVSIPHIKYLGLHLPSVHTTERRQQRNCIDYEFQDSCLRS